MNNSNFNEEAKQELRMALKRCRPEVVETAVEYQISPDESKASIIVLGIIERFLEPESRPKIRESSAGDYRMIEDLGVDSLVMVEIVMTIEEVLKLSIPNEDLRNLTTINDVRGYISDRINNKEKIDANT